MIRHKKTTILLDATEETTVSQLKSTLEGIMKKPVDEQQLYKVDTKELLDDGRTLGDSGYKSSNAKAQEPATIGLRFKIDGDFEDFDITPYTNPPELPDLMRVSDGATPTGGKE